MTFLYRNAYFFYLCSMKTDNKIITRTFPVIGMGCSMCAGRVEKALHEIEGVENVVVNLNKSNAEITFDNERCNVEILQQAVRDAGYDMLLE